MKKICLYALLLVCVALFIGTLAYHHLRLSGPTDDRNIKTMPLNEVRPGMAVWGKTVYQGRKIALFKGHVWGTVEFSADPSASVPTRVIMAELSDPGRMKYAGLSDVLAGMSGSPVYDKNPFTHKDARLIGALSLGFGTEPVDSIAGITPIGEMLKLTRERSGNAPTVSRSGNGAHSGFTPVTQIFAYGIGGNSADAFLKKLSLQSGSKFRIVPMGLAKLPSSAIGDQDEPPLPGGMFVALLIDGPDIKLGAGCTLTYVGKDGTFLGCGHGITGLGHVRGFPVHKANILGVINDRRGSTKMMNGIAARSFGAIENDRFTGVEGVVGEKAQMIPVDIKVRGPSGKAEVKADVVQYAGSSDLLTLTLLQGLFKVGDLSSCRLMVFTSTITVRGIGKNGNDSVRTIHFTYTERLPSVIDTFFGSEAASKQSVIYQKASEAIGNIFSGLLAAPPGMNIRFDKVDLRVELLNEDGGLSKESLKIIGPDGKPFGTNSFSDKTLDMRRGQSLRIIATIKDLFSPKDYRSYLDVKIPDNAELGPARLAVGDGANFTDWWNNDDTRSKDVMYRNGFDGLIDNLVSTEKNSRTLYVRVDFSPPFRNAGSRKAAAIVPLKWAEVPPSDAQGKALEYHFEELPFPLNMGSMGGMTVINLNIKSEKKGKQEQKRPAKRAE
ncbi:MAG TPA: hypothetical protein VNG29_00345 [Candidatus Paceibacterota bacterium]|nr:hypothetical protein [Candidatus Paceibacterota bacterium]